MALFAWVTIFDVQRNRACLEYAFDELYLHGLEARLEEWHLSRVTRIGQNTLCRLVATPCEHCPDDILKQWNATRMPREQHATCHCTAVSGPASRSSRLDITISRGPRSPRNPLTAHSGWSTPTTRTRPVISSSAQAFATTTATSSPVSTWCLSGSEVAINTPRTSSPIS